jgi:hypothetical protein
VNAEAFWASFERSGDCWVWPYATRGKGYGAVSLNGVDGYAHRFAWTLTNGEIPAGLSVLHRCDNPPCGNPDHLFLGTLADNNRDMVSKGRQASGERARHARLTESEVIEIRRRHAAGERQYLLASEFGVTKPTIHRVVRGHAWKHLLKESA